MKDIIKIAAVVIARVFTHLFWIFPIKQNRILFVCHNGGQFSCNPKYIFEKLHSNNNGQYELIWAFNDVHNFKGFFDSDVILVRYRSLKYYYYKATSKITICNVNGSGEVGARKKQFDIQTWHGGGGGYKKSSTDDKTISKLDIYRLKMDNKRYSLCCASSRTNMNNTILGAMHHKGWVLGGTPRNDILINHDRHDLEGKVKKHFGLSMDERLLLFAPTWRKDRKPSDYALDYRKLQEVLHERFGGHWTILLRLHHMVKMDENTFSDQVINATHYSDMQELLYVSDVLMTDYSSSIWDFSFTYKPCFLLCTDLDDFDGERGFYSPIDTWGFPIARSTDELYQNIRAFNHSEFQKKMDRHHKINESFEDGHATEHVAQIIDAVIFSHGKMPEGIPFKQVGGGSEE